MRKPAFTVVELMTATSIGLLLISLTWGVYLSIVRASVASDQESMVAQNARVIVDRISRDVRQTTGFAQSLPDTAAAGVSSLEFVDGHEPDPAGPVYIRYSLSGTDVWRRRHYYYKADQPDTRVTLNAGDTTYEEGDARGGSTGIYRHELEGTIVADGVKSLIFYGTATLVKIDVVLQRQASGPTYSIHSAVSKRN